LLTLPEEASDSKSGPLYRRHARYHRAIHPTYVTQRFLGLRRYVR
jgi:hypothetical protein